MNGILKHDSPHRGGHYLHLADDIPFSSAPPPSTEVVLKFTSRMSEGKLFQNYDARVVKHGQRESVGGRGKTDGEKKKGREGENLCARGSGRERQRETRFHPNDALKIFHSRDVQSTVSPFSRSTLSPFFT